MKQIKARELLNSTLDDIWVLANEKRIKLVLDDGALVTSGRATILSWMMWEFHRRYPTLPVIKSHVIPLRKYTDDTTLNHCNMIMWDTYDHMDGTVGPYELINVAGEVINNIYNLIVGRMGEYVGSSCAIDYYEILKDPKIKNIINTADRTPDGLKGAKDDIKNILQSPDTYQNNSLKFICETGIANWAQLLQVVGFRGFCTDINSAFYNEAIMPGYAHGITDLASSIIESRGGAKSIMSNEDPIRKTEYFNRRMQLLLQHVQNLIHGDCGTTKYLTVPVIGKDGPNGGNFDSLINKYRILNDGSLSMITKNDTHLIGEVIQIRSSVHCKYRSEYSICSTCFGGLSVNVPPNTNLGHWCSIALCSIITQLTLSTKHVDGAAAVAALTMTAYHRRYLRREDDKIFLSPRLKGKRIIITIAKDDIRYLEDLRIFNAINTSTVARMTAITVLNVTVQDQLTGMSNFTPLDMRLGKSPVHLSIKMMEYIKEHGWSNSDNGDYQIDMTNYDYNNPIITLPKLHRNMLEFMKSISEFIESVGGKKAKHVQLQDYNDPGEALLKFFDLINEELDLKLATLEPFILAFMVTSVKDRDGRIPDINTESEFAPTDKLVMLRSAALGMSYGNQSRWMDMFESFRNDKRPPHPSDGLLMPTIFNK